MILQQVKENVLKKSVHLYCTAGAGAEIAAVHTIPRTRLAETAAMELRQRVKSGAMTGLLPGVRLLSKSLGVSVPTLCEALRLLEGEGILTSGGGRRRWQISGIHAASADGKPDHVKTTRVVTRGGRLLYLTPRPLSDERRTNVELFANILDQMSGRGWDVIHRMVAYDKALKPRRAWDEVLKLTQPDALIALGGTPVLAKWARERGVRTLFLGGAAGGGGVSVVAAITSTMLGKALDRLFALGHRSILLPLCGRSSEFVEKCRKVAATSAAAACGTSDWVTIPETPYASPQVLVDLLRRHWRKQVPDALILLDWREFVAASCFLRDMRIAIPKDLSVVILSHNSNMDWHLPPITHFEIPTPTMARIAANWVADGKTASNLEPMTEVRARWIEGKSVMNRNPASAE